MMEPKECKYGCGKVIQWKGKSGKKGSTGFFEVETEIEHTYQRCSDLKQGDLDE